jgi:predicted ATPase/DNA-binding CsgD family transcriptional regulator
MSTFPSSSQLPLAASGLAPPLTPILGRQEELRQIMDLLDRDDLRVVTMLGPGGVGKTRLAHEVARSTQALYAHGAHFVSLETVQNAGEVPKAVAQGLGLRESPERGAPELLAELLADRHMLLVLDNLEQVIGAAAWLSELLSAAPLLKVLGTSRIPLRISGEQQFHVPVLNVPETDVARSAAVQLFVHRAKSADLGFTPNEAMMQDIATICRRLDGLPLAIEMAATWMRVLSPAALLERLDSRLSLLSRGNPDVHPRLQSMAQAIGWSYDLLSEEERILFCRLSLFLSGVPLDAVEFIVAWPDPPRPGTAALDVLQSLIDQNLMQSVAVPGLEGPSFRMLETVREYGLHRVESGDDEQAHIAWVEYCRDVAARAEMELTGPHQARWLNRLDAMYPNLRAAISWLDQNGRLHDAVEMKAQIQFFQNIRGHTVEALGRLGAWLERPELQAPSHTRGLVLMGMGRLLQNTGDLEQSISMLTSAADIFLREGDLRRAAIARGMLASAYALTGDPDAAAASADAALELARPQGVHRTVCAALSVLSWRAMIAGDRDRSRELRDESIRVATEAGDRWSMSFHLVHLVQEAMDSGRFEDARMYAEEWRQLLEDLGSLHDLPNALATLAWIARKEGHLDQAAEKLGEAMSIAVASGNRRLVAFLTMRAGIIAIEQGRLSPAAGLLGGSIVHFRDRAHAIDLAETLDAYVLLASRAGDPRHAVRFLGASTSLIKESGMEPEQLEFDAGGYRLRAELEAALGADGFLGEYTTGAGQDVDGMVTEALAYRPSDVDPSPGKEERPASPFTDLSPRELEVLQHMANGFSNQQIADALFLSLRTVTTHVTRILDKLRVSSRTAAVSIAIRNGLV